MDQHRFDVLARTVWQHPTRRRLLRQMAVLPVLTAIATRLPLADDAEAADPDQHLKDRQDRQRLKARRRKERRLAEQRRDNGTSHPSPPQGAAKKTCLFLGEVCSVLGGDPCCQGMTCELTAVPFLTTCQASCTSTEECVDKLGYKGVTCEADRGDCLLFEKCCRREICKSGALCPNGGKCCLGLVGRHSCCPPGRSCGNGGTCV